MVLHGSVYFTYCKILSLRKIDYNNLYKMYLSQIFNKKQKNTLNILNKVLPLWNMSCAYYVPEILCSSQKSKWINHQLHIMIV